MNSTHYDRYEELNARGLRSDASIALQAFIASFDSFEEKVTWTHSCFEKLDTGHIIRHELYEQIVFPVLLHGYGERDPWSLRWFARTAQNLYRSKNLWSQVQWKTDFEFLKELVSLCPNDHAARQELLHRQIEWFRYCAHEWPSGILYGTDGASFSECEEIIGEVALAMRYDVSKIHSDFLADFETKVRQYRERLGKL